MALQPLSASSLKSLLPSKPEPPAPCGTRELDGRALIGMTRVGGAVVSPDGTQAVLHSKVYDFDAKKFDETLWLVDVAETSGAALAAHAHLTPLDGSKLAWLTMAGAQYEADAIGIKLYDVATKATADLVAPGADRLLAPVAPLVRRRLEIYFTADVRARRRCVVDVASRAVEILGSAAGGSISVRGEIAGGLLVSRDSPARRGALPLRLLRRPRAGVLAVNFRGSTGLGHGYCRDISGDWSIGPDDTVAGVRHVLETYDWIDPSRREGSARLGGFSVNYANGHAPEGMFSPQNSLVWHHAVLSWIKKHTA
ncbi:serine-type peptidase [Aureococcus anophagefferens]|nr:serine-type peptidase [Aureococcus anophagefferens]